MKLLLALSLIIASAFIAQAQTTTNIAYTITVETVSAGVTNALNPATFRYDYGTKKDALRIDGLNFAYGAYLAASTNNTQTFKQWIKQQTQALPDNYAQQKQTADNAALAAKITALLTSNSDLLSNADLNNLQTIAAKAPQ